jgi:acidic leucine-rich nuclear phosphoprotein 32 family protein A/C/D
LAIVLKQIDERIQETEEEIQELALDELKIPKITREIRDKLEKIEDLIALSLNECELEALDNLPNNGGLVRLELSKNKFKSSELSKISQTFPKLQILMLSDNNIGDFKEIQSLSNLKDLIQLDLSGTPLSKKDNYRKKVFEMIPSLEVLDDLDKDGNPYDFEEDEDAEGEDGDDYDDEEEGDDDVVDYDEDDDDDEEYEARGRQKKKVKK